MEHTMARVDKSDSYVQKKDKINRLYPGKLRNYDNFSVSSI